MISFSNVVADEECLRELTAEIGELLILAGRTIRMRLTAALKMLPQAVRVLVGLDDAIRAWMRECRELRKLL